MIVRIFTKPHCQPCRLTKKSFDRLGVPYEEIGLDSAGAIGYVQTLGYNSAPVIEVDCGDGAMAHWSGYRPDQVQQLYDTMGSS